MNNAGIFEREDGLPSQASLEAVRRTLLTNFIGPAAVAQAMLPLLRRSPAGRIVNVSSELGSLALNANPGWGHAWAKFLGYSASKAALNMLTVQLAFELKDTPIKVNSAGPGTPRPTSTTTRARRRWRRGRRRRFAWRCFPPTAQPAGSSRRPVRSRGE
jgi:NAD(P)-dependent dehydrogenase (short-subunit alcohol dehydrogenase family)